MRHFSRAWLSVGLLTVLAALLRFPSLDAKSYWEDEASTVLLLRHGFAEMLSALPGDEAVPPLYYILAWPWAHVFGEGEVGMRSLPALIGTAVVPLAFLAGRTLVSSRAGIAASAFVAVDPMLVWYSQEARAYALLVLTGGLTILLFLRALQRPTQSRLLCWAGGCALALVTHYFAIFLVVPEAVWLLARIRKRRPVAVAVGLVGIVCAALLPLALQQRSNPDWIQEIGLGSRVVEIPGIFLVGFEGPASYALAGVASLLVFVAGWLLAGRATAPERDAALLVGVIGVAAVLLPVALALVGVDYVIYKNVIAALFPLALAAAVGFATTRAGKLGVAAASVYCMLSIGIVLATATEPKYHREDWRGIAAALGEPVGARAIVVTPDAGIGPLRVYLDAEEAPKEAVLLREIALVGAARRGLGSRAEPRTPRPATPPPPAPGFRLVDRVEGKVFTLIRYEADAPVLVRPQELARDAIDSAEAGVLLQTPRAPRRST